MSLYVDYELVLNRRTLHLILVTVFVVLLHCYILSLILFTVLQTKLVVRQVS